MEGYRLNNNQLIKASFGSKSIFLQKHIYKSGLSDLEIIRKVALAAQSVLDPEPKGMPQCRPWTWHQDVLDWDVTQMYHTDTGFLFLFSFMSCCGMFSFCLLWHTEQKSNLRLYRWIRFFILAFVSNANSR